MIESPINSLGRGGCTAKTQAASGPSPTHITPASRRTIPDGATGKQSATARNFIVRYQNMPVRFVTLDDWRSIFLVDFDHPTIFCSEEEARDIAWDYGMQPSHTEIKPI